MEARVFCREAGCIAARIDLTTKGIVWFGLALCLVLGGCSTSTAQSLAVVKDTVHARPEVALDAPPAPATEPTSPLWRAFLWEAMPSEWLGDPAKQPILDAYQQNEWRPFFISPHFEVTRNGNALMSKLAHMDDHALDASWYHPEKVDQLLKRLDQCRTALRSVDPHVSDRTARLPEAGAVAFEEASNNPVTPVQAPDHPGQSSPQAQAASRDIEGRYREVFRAAVQTDILLTQHFLRYSYSMNPFVKEKSIQALLGRLPMDEFLQDLVPKSPHYAVLQSALKRYRKLALEHPKQQTVNAAGARTGDSGSHVRDLQTRLSEEGYYTGKISGVYDGPTRAAVERFQQSHNLSPDGVVGKSTVDWMNVPYADKARMITLSMRMIIESPTRQFDKYVRINIPQFRLEYIKDGKVKDVHRVIVGKASGKKVKFQGKFMGENQTPQLASTIEQVVVNPRWYVTDRIWKELAGDIASDPSFFARHGYVQLASAYSTGAPRVFQQPGPTNPLGQVKFEFPNAYAVFLHDTPKKHLFSQARRDFSHGCVRVEGAKKLAETILSDDQNPATQRIEDYLKGKNPAHIKLNQPVPIVIEYVPVSTNDQDQVIFTKDVYGLLS